MLKRLPKEQKRQIVRLIQDYFRAERDEEMGIIAAERVLDFIAEEIAPFFYNLALKDARRLIQQQMESIDTELYIMEKPLNQPGHENYENSSP